MPKTKSQGTVVTLISALFMVYVMALYNIAGASGKMENQSFLYALRAMWLFYPIAVIAVIFIARPLAQKLTFRLFNREDKPIFILLSIQSFAVCLMVVIMTLIATILSKGFTANFVPQYLTSIWHNFVFAFCLQVFAVGPFARLMSRMIFRNQLKNRNNAERV